MLTTIKSVKPPPSILMLEVYPIKNRAFVSFAGNFVIPTILLNVKIIIIFKSVSDNKSRNKNLI